VNLKIKINLVRGKKIKRMRIKNDINNKNNVLIEK
jgi:hypothetical protein